MPYGTQPETISIHALREEGDCAWKRPSRATANFYPRPPRGGRPSSSTPNSRTSRFLSTPSARRATTRAAYNALPWKISIHALREEGDAVTQEYAISSSISIHALREEGDAFSSGSFAVVSDFYPRPPRGGRPVDVRLGKVTDVFLSTPSARRATSMAAMYLPSAPFLSTPSARRATG